MIKVNKNGWLHKFNKAMSNLPSSHWDNMSNFCEYFWRTVIHIICMSGLIAVLYAALTMIGGSVLGHDNMLTFDWWTWVAAPLVGAFLLCTGGAIVIGIGWLFYYLRDMYRDHRTGTYDTREEKKRRKKERRDSNWIVVMYRSNKDKYCPSVEIVDNDKD